MFLILLVLIQRGKGGGLVSPRRSGAPARSAPRGDQFTRVTIYVALVWLLLIMIGASSGIPQYTTLQQSRRRSRLFGRPGAPRSRQVARFRTEGERLACCLSADQYGEARHQGDALSLSIELRALNNRYLKVSVRAPEPYHLLEAEFEKVIRRASSAAPSRFTCGSTGNRPPKISASTPSPSPATCSNCEPSAPSSASTTAARFLGQVLALAGRRRRAGQQSPRCTTIGRSSRRPW